MCKVNGKLTVFFENQFWVGVFESISDEHLSTCKVTFGAEPKDCEVWEFILKHYYELKFSPAVKIETRRVADNPKRRQRNARKQLKNSGVGTKSQQVLKMQHDMAKTERKQKNREKRYSDKCRQFELRQQKRKEKHKGH